MAQKTRVQLYASNTALYVTNGLKAITAALIRPFNVDVIDSFVNKVDDLYMFKQIEAATSVAVTTGAAQTISFANEIALAAYSLFVNCYDASGNNVDFKIENRTKDGFDVTVPINCDLDYIAVKTASGFVTPVPVIPPSS